MRHVEQQSYDRKTESEWLETDHQTKYENHLKTPSVVLKDSLTVEENMAVKKSEDPVKATCSEPDLPCNAVESTKCPQEEVHEVYNIKESDKLLKDAPVPLNDAERNKTESKSFDSQDKVSAHSLSK